MKKKRKFINKKTGHVAITMTSSSSLELFNKDWDSVGCIDISIAEKGDDWEELSEATPILFSADGCKIFEGEIYYIVNEKYIRLGRRARSILRFPCHK